MLISDVIAIEKYLKDYQINVFRGDNYDEENEGEKKKEELILFTLKYRK